MLTCGGVSVGEEDHLKPALQAEGRLDLWRWRSSPASRLAFGSVRRSGGGEALYIGLPGNPVSSTVTFLLAVMPVLRVLSGASPQGPRAVAMTAGFDWPRPNSRREFLRARVAADGTLELFPNQSSGVLTSMVWADGLVDNPPVAGDRARRHGALPAVAAAVGMSRPGDGAGAGTLLRVAARGTGHRRDRSSSRPARPWVRCATHWWRAAANTRDCWRAVARCVARSTR